MNYYKTLKRLAKKRGLSINQLMNRCGYTGGHQVTSLNRKRVDNLLIGLNISEEQLFLEFLRDSEMHSDAKIELQRLINKYYN